MFRFRKPGLLNEVFLKKHYFLVLFTTILYISVKYYIWYTTPILQIPIINDVHIETKTQEDRFIKALKDYKNIAPNYKAIVVNGDLTESGTEQQYNDFMNILIPNNAQKILTIGNHEFYEGLTDITKTKTDKFYIERFKNKTGENNVYYDKWIEGYHFIVLGSEQSRMSNIKNGDDAIISDEQYNWLEDTLKIGASSSKPIFVFLHQPISNTVYGSETCGTDFKNTKFINILNKYPQVILFSAHSHNLLNHPRTVYQDGFTIVNTGAVAYTCINGEKGYDYGPSEYSQGILLDIYKDRIEIKAREFSNHTFINAYTIKFPYKKTIYDSQRPYFKKNSKISIGSFSSGSLSISWDKAVDNTLIDRYVIKYNGKTFKTLYTKFWEESNVTTMNTELDNIKQNTEYNIEIYGVDAWNNITQQPLTIKFKLNDKDITTSIPKIILKEQLRLLISNYKEY